MDWQRNQDDWDEPSLEMGGTPSWCSYLTGNYNYNGNEPGSETQAYCLNNYNGNEPSLVCFVMFTGGKVFF